MLSFEYNKIHHRLLKLEKVIAPEAIDNMRRLIASNLLYGSKTRDYDLNWHIPYFQRYSELESIHKYLLKQEPLNSAARSLLNSDKICSTSISDITVNRSQDWHKDLFRGPYRNLLPMNKWNPFDEQIPFAYRCLVYLQDGKSLQVISGSDTQEVCLENDSFSKPQKEDQVITLQANAGDVIFFDIRTTHRGKSYNDCSRIKTMNGIPMMIGLTLTYRESRWLYWLEFLNRARLRDWHTKHDNRYYKLSDFINSQSLNEI